jgi:two-component system, NarL family, nitrate/nitrite response regulator NarL
MNDRRSRIVLVEDHPIMQMVIRETIERDVSLTVQAVVGSAEAALALADVATADLLLVDVSLPRMNGIDLVRALQEAHPGLRCLMLSGHLEQRYVTHSLAAGACGYVAKDDTEELLEAVACALGGGTYISRALRKG